MIDEYIKREDALKAEERHNELTMDMAKKALANAKADVAREIFEEIERLLREHSDWEILCDGKSLWYYEESLGKDIAELKKKYTEN